MNRGPAPRPGLHELWLPGVAASAVVSQRAAALRVLRVGGEDLVEPTPTGDQPPGMAGAILAPWPNRVAGACWRYRGRELRLAVTEPELGHANHGLLASTDFEPVATGDPGRLRLRAVIDQPPGYPFTIEVEYRLRPDGMAVALTARNAGDEPAPVALGAHSYLRVGATPAERLTVRVDADTAHELDATHIPCRRFAVAGTGWDLRAGRAVRDAPPHATFEHSAPPRVLVHALLAPDGRAVELRADSDFRWTQLYVADGFVAADGPRLAVAIEPMTAPPNALRTGVGLRTLEPGAVWRTGFDIRLGSARPAQPRSRLR